MLPLRQRQFKRLNLNQRQLLLQFKHRLQSLFQSWLKRQRQLRPLLLQLQLPQRQLRKLPTRSQSLKLNRNPRQLQSRRPSLNLSLPRRRSQYANAKAKSKLKRCAFRLERTS